jgi:protein ImuB
LRLVPEEVVSARGHQLEFWAGDARAGEQAARVLARLQGMLGHEAVVQPAVHGGRTPGECTALVPFGDAVSNILDGAVHKTTSEGAPPWPGRVPPPTPALIYDPPLPAALTDAEGRPVQVSGRGELSAHPVRFRCDHPAVDAVVEQCAGPWIHDVRSWDPASRHRRALFQVVAGGVACLVALEHGRADVLAVYD